MFLKLYHALMLSIYFDVLCLILYVFMINSINLLLFFKLLIFVIELLEFLLVIGLLSFLHFFKNFDFIDQFNFLKCLFKKSLFFSFFNVFLITICAFIIMNFPLIILNYYSTKIWTFKLRQSTLHLVCNYI